MKAELPRLIVPDAVRFCRALPVPLKTGVPEMKPASPPTRVALSNKEMLVEALMPCSTPELRPTKPPIWLSPFPPVMVEDTAKPLREIELAPAKPPTELDPAPALTVTLTVPTLRGWPLATPTTPPIWLLADPAVTDELVM